MNQSPSNTAERKPPREQTELARLMTEMGSTEGFDPIPPDQYRYFLGKSEPPLQRLLALVRSLTLAKGHRSPYCVDDKGRELHLADLERLLEIDHGNFMRAVKEAKTRGLIRIGGKHHRARPHAVFLAGRVKESTGYEGGEEKGGVSADTYPSPFFLRFSPARRAVISGWPVERQQQFYTRIEAAVLPIFDEFKVPWANKSAVSAPTRVSADTSGVSAPTPLLVSAPTLASLLVQRTTREEYNPPPSTATSSAAHRGEEAVVASDFEREFAERAEHAGKFKPGTFPEVLIRKLCQRALKHGADAATAAAVFVRVHAASLEKEGIRDGVAYLLHAFEAALEVDVGLKSRSAGGGR